MTREILDALSAFVTDATAHFSLPTAVQQGDTEQLFRAPEVHKMRLPQSTSYKKYAPYIIVQYVTSKDVQKHGERSDSTAAIRLIFCVYNDDEEAGSLDLVNVIDAVRLRLLREVVIAGKYRVDTDASLETLIYIDDTAPYYGGEMMFTVEVPPIEREVDLSGI